MFTLNSNIRTPSKLTKLADLLTYLIYPCHQVSFEFMCVLRFWCLELMCKASSWVCVCVIFVVCSRLSTASGHRGWSAELHGCPGNSNENSKPGCRRRRWGRGWARRSCQGKKKNGGKKQIQGLPNGQIVFFCSQEIWLFLHQAKTKNALLSPIIASATSMADYSVIVFSTAPSAYCIIFGLVNKFINSRNNLHKRFKVNQFIHTQTHRCIKLYLVTLKSVLAFISFAIDPNLCRLWCVHLSRKQSLQLLRLLQAPQLRNWELKVSFKCGCV